MKYLYKDQLGHTYEVPAYAVNEFERRRRVLLTIAVVCKSIILGGILWFAWTH